jgi:glycosyltransferase involved in cell wall biosynthesis
MRELYLDSFCLISTSFKEGFPNTFLEAWETGIPVASLHVDPNATLSKQNLGFHANGNMDALAEKIKDWQESPKNAANLGFQGRKYVELHHDSKVIREQLAQLFLSLGQ